MDLKLQQTEVTSGDQSYLVKPADITEVGCTIDLSLFNSSTLDGWAGRIPGGVGLGIKTATGCCGPVVDDAGVKVQTLTRSATSGHATLSADGETTTSLTTSAGAFIKANIDAALLALSNINPGDFTSVQTSATVLTITGNIPTLTVNDVDMSGGTVTAAVATAAVSDGTEVFAGVLFDSIRFPVGAHSGKIGASRIVVGALYESKLPLADSAVGTPGRVTAALVANSTKTAIALV